MAKPSVVRGILAAGVGATIESSEEVVGVDDIGLTGARRITREGLRDVVLGREVNRGRRLGSLLFHRQRILWRAVPRVLLLMRWRTRSTPYALAAAGSCGVCGPCFRDDGAAKGGWWAKM